MCFKDLVILLANHLPLHQELQPFQFHLHAILDERVFTEVVPELRYSLLVATIEWAECCQCCFVNDRCTYPSRIYYWPESTGTYECTS